MQGSRLRNSKALRNQIWQVSPHSAHNMTSVGFMGNPLRITCASQQLQTRATHMRFSKFNLLCAGESWPRDPILRR
eukprot:1604555-Amphidinium_carterae.1